MEDFSVDKIKELADNKLVQVIMAVLFVLSIVVQPPLLKVIVIVLTVAVGVRFGWKYAKDKGLV